MINEELRKKGIGASDVFGRMTVRRYVNSTTVIVKCRCGTVKTVTAYDLRHGRVVSCGCKKKQGRHGHTTKTTKSGTYGCWRAMLSRTSPTTRAFVRQRHLYGDRNIDVCQRWKQDFAAFLSDMGPRPSPKHTIERIDNDRGYGPDNCRWALMHEQSRNKRTNVVLTYRGESMVAKDWAARLGIPSITVYSRLKRGWTTEEALRPGKFTGIKHGNR